MCTLGGETREKGDLQRNERSERLPTGKTCLRRPIRERHSLKGVYVWTVSQQVYFEHTRWNNTKIEKVTLREFRDLEEYFSVLLYLHFVVTLDTKYFEKFLV